jgi:DNA invertase Pin-like site-specific DNA recombinase
MKKQEKGDSIRRQTEMRDAYIKRKGWTLSEQTYKDLGVSAFKGKNALVGNLAEFLKAVHSGAVKQGSVLIVESLDRISRQGIDEGYEIVKRILKSGIILVTLSPEREFDVSATKSLSKGALEIQLILERAAEESERKSDRIKAVWSAKQSKARENPKSVIVAGCLPAWIERHDGKLRLIPDRAKVVRRIFKLAASGYGRSRIVQALEAEGIPPFCGEKWAHCSIGFILTDRRALGEYQPRKVSDNKRLKNGEVIPDYYPAVVTEQEWLAARAGMGLRRRKISGRPWTEAEDKKVRDLSQPISRLARDLKRTRAAVHQRRTTLGLTVKQNRGDNGNFINIFSGLIRNARPPHDTYIVVSRMDGNGPSKALLNSAHAGGLGKCYLFQLAPFEKAILEALRELDPRDILPPADDAAPDEVKQHQDALAGLEVELAEAAAFMEDHGFSATIGKRIKELEAKKTELAAQLQDAQARATCPAAAAWEEYGSLLDAMEKAPDRKDARLRLKNALRRIVSEIRLLVVPHGWERLAVAHFYFVGGGWRDYLIMYRPARSNGRARYEGRWYSASAREWDEDFRDNADAVEAVENFLANYPQKIIDELLAKGFPLT